MPFQCMVNGHRGRSQVLKVPNRYSLAITMRVIARVYEFRGKLISFSMQSFSTYLTQIVEFEMQGKVKVFKKLKHIPDSKIH